MKDVRPMAEERARNRAGENPSGNGFVTERARAKEALRAEVSTYTGENVRKIAAAAEAAPDDRILRVARTCADLNGHEQITDAEISEACQYRVLDQELRPQGDPWG